MANDSTTKLDATTLNTEIKAQIATEFVAGLTEALEEACFTRCFRKPGIRMEAPEEACLSKCMDRFLESWGLVTQTITKLTQRIAENEGKE